MVSIVAGKGVGLVRTSPWVIGSEGQLGSASLGRAGDNVYVNAANGNLIIARQDEFLIGRGPDVSIDRTYNSQTVAGITDGDNGDNWRIGVYRKLTAIPVTYGAVGSSVKRIDWDGSDTLYTWNATENAYVATDGGGAHDTLTRTGTTWTWTDGDSRIVETYDETAGGRLTATRDTDLNSLSYTYNGAGLITRVTGQNGEYSDLSYNGSNQLTQLVTVKSGGATLTRVRYGYDSSNRLSTVTVDLSPDDNSVADSKTYTTTYAYDGASKRVASISQLDGSSVSFSYVLVGADFRVSSYTQTVAAGVTRATGFNYSVPGQTTITDPTGLQTVLSYNANSELTQIAYPQGVGTTARTVQFSYLANGDLTSTTYAPGNVVSHTYDSHGNPLTDTDSAGNRVERSYSAKNELLRVTRFLAPDTDGAGPIVATQPVTTRYVYDGNSHLVYEVGAEGSVTRHDYNALGQRIRTTDYPAHFFSLAGLNPGDPIAKTTLDGWVPADKSTTRRTDTSYNFRGAIDTVTSWSKVLPSGEFDTGSERSQTVHVYDQAGNLLSRVVTGSSGSETFTYDGLGRVVTATDFNNVLTRTYFFDALAQTVVTHANGLSEVATYNKAGELVSFARSQAGANLVDLSGWPANPDSVPAGQATVPGWMNPGGFTDETRWAATPGPDGVQVVAMQAGQLDASAEGGGNYTHEAPIDGTKAYEFTYYFKLSDRGKHNLYFGLSGTSPATVENLNGTDNTNPYFVVVNTTDQNNYLVTDRWYKAVGYVLPQGAADPGTPLGGVYDTTTGQLVLNATAFRWNAERPAGNTVHSRFFDYNGETSIQYSTYFYQPEIRQVSAAAITAQATSTTQYRYDSRGHLRLTIDPTGRRNYMVYDGVGRKVADVDSDGSVTEYRYNSSGLLTSTTRWATRLTTLQLDALADFDSWGDGGSANPTGTNKLVNGSFETVTAGATALTHGYSSATLLAWVKANTENFEQVAVPNFGVTGADGTYWLDLDSVPGGGVTTTGPNLVLNPSFDSSGPNPVDLGPSLSNATLPNWLKNNGHNFEQVKAGQMGVTGYHGSHWLDLDSVPGTGLVGTGPNLLLNGSFEQSDPNAVATGQGLSNATLPNWTKTNSEAFEQVNTGVGGVAATQGSYWLDLESVAGAGGFTPIGANLLTNGGFEVNNGSLATSTGHVSGSMPGWVKTNPQAFEQIGYAGMPVTSTEGAYWLDMDSVAGGTVPVGANLIVNGSFEQSAASYTVTATGRLNTGPIPGWTGGVFEQVNSGVGGVTASNGAFYIDSDASTSNMNISQTVTGLTAGQQMLIQFDYANYAGFVGPEYDSSGSLAVYWNNNLVAYVGEQSATMITKSYQVTSIGGTNTLRFQETGIRNGLGVSLDNVRLFQTQTAPANGGNMDISQTVSLTAGQTVQLRFDHANRTTAASGGFEVYWNGGLIDTITSPGTVMQEKTYNLATVAGSNTIRFKGIGTVDAVGASIDNVRLHATQALPNGGNMDVRQTVSGLTAGQMYELVFDHANRAPAGSGNFDVYWNDTKLETITYNGTPMLTKSYFVQAAAGNNFVRFVGLGTVDAVGASIDNVRLFATTTPVGGGNMDVYQTITGLTAGQLYQFQFDHANRAAAGSGDFDVYWNGQLLPPVTYSGTAMQTQTHLVTAAAGGNTIRFVGKGTVDAVGASIDNVRLFATLPVTGGGNMDVSQTVSGLTAGQVMQLQFNHANRTSAASGSFEVYWNNNLVATITDTGSAMQTKTFLVAATGGSNTLRFKGTGTVDAVGASIDNVRLFSTTPGVVGSTGSKLGDVRPAGVAEDVWTWNVYDAAQRLVETIDGTGAATVIAYDGASRILSTTGYFGRIGTSTVNTFKTTTPTSIVTPGSDPTRDRVVRNFYDNDGRLTGTLDAEGYLTKIVYDKAGQKTKTIAYRDETDPAQRAGGTWDALLNTVTVDNSKDIHDYFVYDSRGMLRATVDGEGNLTRYRYTPLGDVDQIITGQKLDPATLLATPPTFASLPAAPAGTVLETVTYSRNLYGQVLTETRSLTGSTSTVTSYTYDSLRRLVSTTTQSGGADPRTTTLRYDLRGRLTGEMGGIGNAGLPGSPTQAQIDQAYSDYGTVHVYDAADRLTSSTDPLGARTLYYYNADGRLIFQVNALGETGEYRYDSLGQRTDTIVYAARIAAGTLAGMTGGALTASVVATMAGLANAALDTATHVDFNLDGTAKQSIDALGSLTSFTYNGFGELATRTDPLDGSTTVQTSFTYDRRGLLKTQIVDSDVGGKNITTAYGYDSFGRAIELTNANTRLTKTDYDRAGRVVGITDALNNKTSFTYDARGNMVAVKDALNNVTRYVYDQGGRRIFEVDALGGLIATTYDSDGRVLSVRAHRVPVSTQGFGLEIAASDITWQMTNASDDRITSNAYDKDGRLRFIVQGTSLSEWRYDDAGNVIRTIRYGWAVTGSSYALADLQAQVTAHDAAGDPKRIDRSVFDTAGRRTWSIDAAGSVISFSYDSKGQVIKQVAFATLYTAGGDPGQTAMQGWATTSAHADDRTSRAIYDRQGRLVYSVDAKGFVTEHRYTKAGGVKTQIRYASAYTVADGATQASVQAILPGAIPASATVTNFFYDRAGRLERTEDSLGGQTVLTLDQLGQATISTQTAPGTSATVVTLREYDELGRVKRETRGDGTPAEVTTLYGYSALSQLISITYAEGTAAACVTTRIYDELGRLESETRADGHPEETTTAYTYTAFGDVESIAYAAGTVDESVTKRFYDVRGRLESEVRAYWSDHSTNTIYGYNAFGDVQSVQVGALTMDEALTTRTYDARGQLETETRGDGSVDETTTAYTYTAFGEVKTITRASGTIDASTTTHRYDALGRIASVRQQVDGDPNHDLVTTNEYDGFGNLVKVTDPRLNSIHYYYDELGRVELQIDQQGYATKTAYHALHGQAGTVTRYFTGLTGPFDVAARPTPPTDARDATTQFHYDSLGRLIGVTDAENHSESYDLDILGNRIKLTNKLGGETDYTYDKLGRVKTRFVHADVHDQEGTLQATGTRTDFDYDKRGNLISKTEGANLPSWDARTITYKYDQLDRLIEIDREDLASVKNLTVNLTLTMKDSFLYDRRGNLIEEKLAGGPTRNIYYYDKLDRRVREVGPLGRLSVWDYDGNGNILSHRIYADLVEVPAVAWAAPPNPVDPNDFRETRFSYDKANRLKTTRGPTLTSGRWNGTNYVLQTGEIVRNIDYDAAGNVIREYVGDVETRNFFDKANRKIGQLDAEGYLTVFERDSEGNVLKETRHATRVTGPIDQNATTDQLHSAAGVNASDRITEFTYDRNGRRRTEMRRNVEAWAVSTVGALAPDTDPNHVHSKIEYQYNGFGQVVRKIEANGDDTVFDYDDQGRLTRTTGESFIGYQNISVTPIGEHRYNAFGEIVRTVLNPASADARISRFYYNSMGWLETVVDAEGTAHSYVHNGAGKVVADKYSRTKADGTITNEAISYSYDAYGLLTGQSVATRLTGGPNPTYSFGDSTNIKYNTYGEMTGRGINTDINGNTAYQETFDYDEGGRLWRTTSGDGTIKIMLRDVLGNVTLTLSSTGANLAPLTPPASEHKFTDTLPNLALAANGDTGLAGAVTTIAVFDKRGQQTATIEPDRQLKAGSPNETISRGRAFNAFGEVTSETDARNNTTEFLYNSMGRLVEKRSPLVVWTDQYGTQHLNERPIEKYRYDVAGRMVATVDAAGFETRRHLLAGTGHAGSEAQVTTEFHADGGKAQILYDQFGDARIKRNEYWVDANSDLTKTDVLMKYDKRGRLSEVQHLGRLLTETFVYDVLDQRTRRTMDRHDGGADLTEYTEYDRQGRVASRTDFGNDLTTYSYVWHGEFSTGPLGNLGGWLKKTTDAGGRDATESTDYFDHTIAREDFGDNAYSYSFDAGGRLTAQTVGSETTSYSYLNTGRLSTISNGVGSSTAYGYDAAGNETSEVTYKSGVLVQNAVATFDALDRLASWQELGTSTLPAASILYEYDRVGNIRRQKSSFQRLDGHGQPWGLLPTQDNWYLYDSMNRVTTDRGFLVGQNAQGETVTGDAARGIGNIRRQLPGILPLLNNLGEVGADYTYDAAGRRMSMAVTRVRFEGGPIAPNAYFRENKEMYDYFADGSLSQTRWALGAEQLGPGSVAVAPASGTGAVLSSFTRDALGRVTSQMDYNSPGVVGFSRVGIIYNDKGQITQESGSVLRNDPDGLKTYSNTTTYDYGTGASYALGAVVQSTSTNYKQGAFLSTVTTTNTYIWRDGAANYTTQVLTVPQQGGTTNYTTTYYYSPSSELVSVGIVDGRPRTVNLTNDMSGQILRRDEVNNSSVPSPNGTPHEIWYRFGGRQMGHISNNGTLDTDYASSLTQRQITAGQGWFRFGQSTAKTYADFSQSTTLVNSYAQGSSGGDYVVRAGDTLQSVAASLWGNADLWYKLAEVNGLSGASQLVEGQSLTVPIGVVSNAHNSGTFKPYDAGKALGDLSPTTPKPPKKPGGCGMLGTLIVAAIAIAVTLIIKVPVANFIMGLATSAGATAATAAAITAVAGAAVTAGVASAVSQGIGVATGLTEKFSWKGVALSALSAGVGAGIAQLPGSVGAFLARDALISNIAQATSAKAVTEGIAVAVGLKKNFDWAGIAAAGAAAAVGGIVSRSLPGRAVFEGGRMVGGRSYDNAQVSDITSIIAGAGARALFTGTSFGDNVAAVLPDIIIATIGNAIAYGQFSGGGEQAPAPQPESSELSAVDLPADFPGQPFPGETPEAFRDRQIQFVTGRIVRPERAGGQGSGSAPEEPLSPNFDTTSPSGTVYGYRVDGNGIFANTLLDAIARGDAPDFLADYRDETAARGMDTTAGDYAAINLGGDGPALIVLNNLIRSSSVITSDRELAAVQAFTRDVRPYVDRYNASSITVTGTRPRPSLIDRITGGGQRLINRSEDSYYEFRRAQNTLRPWTRVTNFLPDIAVSLVHQGGRIALGAVDAVVHPIQAIEDTIQGFDNILLDDTPALEYARRALAADSTDVSRFLGRAGANVLAARFGRVPGRLVRGGNGPDGPDLGRADRLDDGPLTRADPGPAAAAAGLRIEARNGYRFTIDARGRVVDIEGDVSVNPNQGRNKGAQLRAGGPDRLRTDDGGHFVGRALNGPLDDFNHFAQDSHINRGAYRTLENALRREVEGGAQVRIRIRPTYPGTSLRPNGITVDYWVNGVPDRVRFTNRREGR